MVSISQTDYIDFISKSGTSKLTKVLNLIGRQDYHPSFDFYKKLRDTIIDNLKSGKKKHELLDFVNEEITDRKKLNRYITLVEGLSRFLGRKKTLWFDPPTTIWSHKDLRIKMNPELGLDLNGEKFIIKLYFKDTSLQRKDIKVLLWMMNQSLSKGIFTGYKCALLDVEKGKFFSFKEDVSEIKLLVEGEAEYFLKLWHELQKKSA